MKKQTKTKIIKNLFWVLPILVVILAVLIRFSPVLEDRDFWYDEAFTGILLKQPLPEMNQMIFDDVHPPLHYWIAKPWSAMFDYSPAGIRSLSIVFGVLTVISLFWIGWKMFNKRAGMLAAIIATFSPFAIQYSQEARMYSLFGFLLLWAVWFFYRALQKNKIKDWVLWGVFGGLAFLTHYLSLFFFVMFYVAYVLYQKNFNKKEIFNIPFTKKAKNKGAVLFGDKGFWIGVGVIALFFLSWIKIFITHMLKGNLGWIDVSYLSDIPSTLQIFLFGHLPGTGGVPEANSFADLAINKSSIFNGSSVGLLVLILLTVLFVVAWKKNQKRKEFLVLSLISIGTLAFLILLSYVNIKLYVSRYFMPSAVLFYLLGAGLITEVFKKKWAWLITLFIYALLLLGLNQITYQTGWSQFFKAYEKGLFQKEYIITSNPFEYTSARYYFGKDKVRYYNKANPMEDFSGWVVVGNENRIEDEAELMEYKESSIVVDRDCNWEIAELEKVAEFEDYQICKIK